MSNVWDVAPYNTDEDEWRERDRAKLDRNHARWETEKAAREASYEEER